jgi:hypothetical protein
VWSSNSCDRRSKGAAPIGFTAPTAGDDFATLGCRKISVILLTDGDETCNGDPLARANDLHSVAAPFPGGGSIGLDVRTYVIGFGIDQGDSNIENIGESGCTCSGSYSPNSCTADADPSTPCDPCKGSCSGNRGFYAQNEAELSAAFNQIIADAQLSAEICNDKDDNCNGLIDEGVVKYCDKPNNVIEPTLCGKPPETLCDGQDDNCDGQTDEGLFNACGVCGEVPQEVCDGIDNDCDGATDEAVDQYAECGSSAGNCLPGVLKCIDGQYECIGETGPKPEQCNCIDDDCDSYTDEDPTGTLCPPGYVCYHCECVPLCEDTVEFGQCEVGRMSFEDEQGRCLCLLDACDPSACATRTIERDGEVACASSDENVSACVCHKGECIPVCEAIRCQSGQICDPKKGQCVVDRCEYLGCGQGQRCDATSGKCVADLCAEAACSKGQVCRDGICEPTCADKSCNQGYICRSGVCATDRCASAACEDSQVCDPDTGDCTDDLCRQMSCGSEGLVCEPVSGECLADPCSVVRCPEGQECKQGECYAESSQDGRESTKTDSEQTSRYFAAAGGGGCSCAVVQPRLEHSWLGLFCLAGCGLLLLRKRRHTKGLVANRLP